MLIVQTLIVQMLIDRFLAMSILASLTSILTLDLFGHRLRSSSRVNIKCIHPGIARHMHLRLTGSVKRPSITRPDN